MKRADNFRDARLQQALDHAPDAQERPAALIRMVVKNMAQAALLQAVVKPVDEPVASPSTRPVDVAQSWWTRLWADAGRAGAPWPAAFATVVLGVVITLAWQGQDVPDAMLDAAPDRVAKAAAAAAPSVAPAILARPQIQPAQMPPSVAVATADSERAARTAQPKKAKEESAQKQLAGPDTKTPSVSGATSALPSPATAADVLAKASVETRTQPSSSASTSPSTATASSTPTPPPMMPPAPAVQVAAEAPAAAPAPQAAGASSRLADSARKSSSPMSSGAAPDWASAELVYRGRSKILSKSETQVLASRLETLTAGAAPTSADGPTGQPDLRLVLNAQAKPARPDPEFAAPSGTANSRGALALREGGSFELWGNTFRWRRAGMADVTGIASAQALAALLADLGRVMPL